MNRTELRRARQFLSRARVKGRQWTQWEPANLKLFDNVPRGMTKAWKNNVYIVQLYPEDCPLGLLDHLMIQTLDGAPFRSWPDFQRIKNELLGEEREAVEIYPPESEKVDDCNVYHLYVLPAGKRIGFGLRFKG